MYIDVQYNLWGSEFNHTNLMILISKVLFIFQLNYDDNKLHKIFYIYDAYICGMYKDEYEGPSLQIFTGVFIVKSISISNLNPDFSNNELVKFTVNLIKV